MLYYLIGEKGSVYIKEIENATDRTYQELKNQGFILHGVFGRLDYATIWKDFYNGKINREELKTKLN
jgi:hypothetical protein